MFNQQLLGAWRALGFDASPRPDGSGITFGCPKCGTLSSRLEVEDGIVSCPDCSWMATGEPWEIGAEAVKVRPSVATADVADIAALLEKARYNPLAPPPQPTALYSLAGHIIATAENIMVVQAKMKAGKSAAIGAMIAATMEPTGDCLGFASSNPRGLAVLHFDTEQSAYDHHRLISRSLHRAGRSTAPDWFFSYHVKGHSIATIKKMVTEATDQAAQKCGGVHSSICDGIADLCADVNDAAEANALVAEMEALAMQYRTLIACVLHENHGSDSGKTRGHLGSQLARKAETNLRLEKDKDGTTLMFADTSRSVHITKKNAPGFRWSDDARSHVSVLSTIGAVAADRDRDTLIVLAVQIFGVPKITKDGIAYGLLRQAIELGEGVSTATAERKIAKMRDFFIITKTDDTYFPGPTLNPHLPSNNPQ